jgi:S1-C subfamily serine protease
MSDLATDYFKPVQLERTGDNSSTPWAASEPALWSKPAQALDSTVLLPTLHLHDDTLNKPDVYSVNSDVAQLYLKNRPAIVRINTMDPKEDSGFSTSAGSGSIVDSSGIILTGYHVVKDATALRVKTADGTVYDAKILAADAAKDEALVQINSPNPFASFPTVKLAADSSAAQTNEKLLGLGFPKNQDAMHISLLTTDNRLALSDLKVKGGLLLGEDPDRTLIKTDGPVDNGNSGGPAFDRRTGEQIGIVNLNDETNGTAYITPVEDAQRFLAETKAKYHMGSFQMPIPSGDSSPFTRLSPVVYTAGQGLENLDRVLNKLNQ